MTRRRASRRPPRPPRRPSRRHVLGALAAAGAATLFDPGAVFGPGSVLGRLAAQQPCDPGTPWGALLGTLPLGRAGARSQPYGVKFGRGLEARLVTDLSLLEPDRLVTPNALAYIRTECPPAAAAHDGPWTIRASGLPLDEGARDAGTTGSRATEQGVLSLDELGKAARPMGLHLFECSGNDNPANFGLMSVADWDGVPLTDVVARLAPSARATGVLVGGVDHDAPRSAGSVAGASWIVPLASLDRIGAFLAVRMNGAPLPPDHGYPVRLVVPRWYGCAWIKWVNEVRLVGPEEPATSQMREFAGRTHQTRRHVLARDYTAPEIEAAAMPVRVEKRRGAAGVEYRVVGIVWGGAQPVDRLAIRFGGAEAWRPFAICPAPRTHATWSLWEYRWIPERAGVHDMTLRVADPSVPQRRLDAGFYMRQISIDEA